MVDEKLSDQIDWDGRALCFSAKLKSGKVHCRVPRDTVHAIYIYNDAMEREIVRDRFRIVEKLTPFLRAKLSHALAGETLEIHPEEISD